MQALPLILSSVLLSAAAQVMLKLGVRGAAAGAEGAPGVFLLSASLNPYVICGVSMHVGALVIWLLALRHADVSFAYPFTAFGFVLVLLVSALWLHEPVNGWRVMGILLIAAGIVAVSRS